MKRRPGTSVRPGRFHLHGFEVEVEPTGAGEWRARVVSEHREWQTGRHAWAAMDAAVLALLAARPGDEVYVHLLEPGAREAEPHSEPLVAA